MFRDVWTKTLWDNRRSLLGWAVGLIGVTLVYGAFYPYMAEPGYADLLDTLPQGLIEAMGWEDFTSAEGYMGAAVFGVLGQVLTVVMAVGLGARMIAGDEEPLAECDRLANLQRRRLDRQRLLDHMGGH